jgi:hypothetical protein
MNKSLKIGAIAGLIAGIVAGISARARNVALCLIFMLVINVGALTSSAVIDQPIDRAVLTSVHAQTAGTASIKDVDYPSEIIFGDPIVVEVTIVYVPPPLDYVKPSNITGQEEIGIRFRYHLGHHMTGCDDHEKYAAIHGYEQGVPGPRCYPNNPGSKTFKFEWPCMSEPVYGYHQCAMSVSKDFALEPPYTLHFEVNIDWSYNDLYFGSLDPHCAGSDKVSFSINVKPKESACVRGEIKDGDGRPLKYVTVELYYTKGPGTGKSLLGSSYSDEQGTFTIDYPSNDPGIADDDVKAFINIKLTEKDNRFRIIWGNPIIFNRDSVFEWQTIDFDLPTEENYIITFRKDDKSLKPHPKLASEPPDVDPLWDAGKIYYDTEKVFTFVQNNLNYDFKGGGTSMPLDIKIWSDEVSSIDDTHYIPGGAICIGPYDSLHQNKQAPENIVWHEFFHYTMYNKYGAFLPYGDRGKNHGGFKNNNTGDSYEEGFAIFWPNIVSQELDGDTKHIYGDYINIELNYNPWVKYGKVEDFACASLFWDLIDSHQDRSDISVSGTGYVKDRISLPYKDLWNVLMSKRLQSVKEVYNAIQNKWPEKRKEIDDVFIMHGFFKDTFKGNGKYDPYEPFWDDNKNGKWNTGETFIDVGTPADGLKRPHQVYTPGEDTVGTATNYDRPTRNKKPLTENSFVKVDVFSDGAPVTDGVFKVSYSFSDPTLNYESVGIVDPDTGFVYVEIPPDEYNMTATISVDNYKDSETITVTADDYYSPETAQNGYMKAGTINTSARASPFLPLDPRLVLIGVFLIIIISAVVIGHRRRKPQVVTRAPRRKEKPAKPAYGFCIECGERLPVNAKHCGFCGAKQ